MTPARRAERLGGHRVGRRVNSGQRIAVAVTACLLAVLAGCSTSAATDQARSGDGQGYVAGSGTVTQWQPTDRGNAVDLTGTTYDDGAVDLADWRDQPVLLNFWYAACPPCRAEADDLVDIATDYADRVHVLGVNSTDEPGAALAFQRTYAVPYPSVHDDDGSAVATLQGVVSLQAVPTTVVLDREGRVAARVLGRADASTLRAVLDEVLQEG